jgi:acyl carrier protein
MIVSARTPEGDPAVCPICGTVTHVEPSLYYGDAPCPSCGSLLWFVRVGLDKQFLVLRPSDEARNKGLAKCLAEWLRVDESQVEGELESLGRSEMDSLDTVELVMELEDLREP